MDELIIAVVSLLLSFFFSGTETAFVSVNKVRVEIWEKQKIRGSGIIKSFVAHPEKFLYTTLVGTNIANIACATYGTLFFMRYLRWGPQLTWLTMTMTILLLGELIPKYLFRNFADFFVRKTAVPLKMFYYLLYPIIMVTGSVSVLFLKLFGLKKNRVESFFSDGDLEILLKESNNENQNEESADREILKNVLKFKNVKVKESMIPRTDIVAIEQEATIAALKKLFVSSSRTRLPVYKEKLDNIVGVVFLKDLFKNPKSVKQITHKIMFVPEYKNIDDLLKEFQKTNQSIAIVVDEYGGTEGLITTEDLLEVLIGEIQDEYDEEKVYIKKVGAREWRVHSHTKIEQFKEELQTSPPESDFDTVGGFLLNRFGHIPKKDEEWEEEGFIFIITKSSPRQIEWIRVKKTD